MFMDDIIVNLVVFHHDNFLPMFDGMDLYHYE